MENCAVNVGRLIAVEPDQESAAELRARAARRLPRVDCRVLETSIQSWTGVRLMGLLQLRFEHDSSTIRVRFERDSSTIQHPTRSYVLSSNNEHVNSFALL